MLREPPPFRVTGARGSRTEVIEVLLMSEFLPTRSPIARRGRPDCRTLAEGRLAACVNMIA